MRKLVEQVLFALGTSITCFAILLSSTLQAHTLFGTTATPASRQIEWQTPDPEINGRLGLELVEDMLKKPEVPQEFCFEDPSIVSCPDEKEPAVEISNPEILPAQIETPFPTLALATSDSCSL